MKFSDIYKPKYQPDYVPKNAIKLMHSAIRKAREVPGHEHVGTGANAYVYKNTSPQSMDSVNRISSIKDPTSKYLQTIANTPDLHNNPFLPRIHEVRSLSKRTREVQMEKLYPLNLKALTEDKEQRLLRSIWEQYLNEDYDRNNAYLTPFEVMNNLAMHIHMALKNANYSRIKDEQLIEALEFIRQFVGEEAKPDIHGGNLMWRITGNMPHLVITDPLAE
jgi:hypothetical protein